MIGEFVRTLMNDNGEYEVTFAVKSKPKIDAIKYDIKLSPITESRSKSQNRYMWLLLREIAEKEDGNLADEEATYCQMLEKASAKFEYIMCLEPAIEVLKKQFRAIKILENRVYNGANMKVVKVFYGSSSMDKAEFTKLLNTIIDYAAQIGIDTDYWFKVLGL